MEKAPSAPVVRAAERIPEPVRQADDTSLQVPAGTPLLLPLPAPGARFTDWAAI
jgi:hypothetical protein